MLTSLKNTHLISFINKHSLFIGLVVFMCFGWFNLVFLQSRPIALNFVELAVVLINLAILYKVFQTYHNHKKTLKKAAQIETIEQSEKFLFAWIFLGFVVYLFLFSFLKNLNLIQIDFIRPWISVFASLPLALAFHLIIIGLGMVNFWQVILAQFADSGLLKIEYLRQLLVSILTGFSGLWFVFAYDYLAQILGIWQADFSPLSVSAFFVFSASLAFIFEISKTKLLDNLLVHFVLLNLIFLLTMVWFI